MENPRVIVYLERDERQALFNLANTEKRDPRQQAAWLIRQSLEHLGLLSVASPNPTNDNRQSGG